MITETLSRQTAVAPETVDRALTLNDDRSVWQSPSVIVEKLERYLAQGSPIEVSGARFVRGGLALFELDRYFVEPLSTEYKQHLLILHLLSSGVNLNETAGFCDISRDQVDAAYGLMTDGIASLNGHHLTDYEQEAQIRIQDMRDSYIAMVSGIKFSREESELISVLKGYGLTVEHMQAILTKRRLYHSQMNLLRIYPSKTALATRRVANQRKMGILAGEIDFDEAISVDDIKIHLSYLRLAALTSDEVPQKLQAAAVTPEELASFWLHINSYPGAYPNWHYQVKTLMQRGYRCEKIAEILQLPRFVTRMTHDSLSYEMTLSPKKLPTAYSAGKAHNKESESYLMSRLFSLYFEIEIMKAAGNSARKIVERLHIRAKVIDGLTLEAISTIAEARDGDIRYAHLRNIGFVNNQIVDLLQTTYGAIVRTNSRAIARGLITKPRPLPPGTSQLMTQIAPLDQAGRAISEIAESLRQPLDRIEALLAVLHEPDLGVRFNALCALGLTKLIAAQYVGAGQQDLETVMNSVRSLHKKRLSADEIAQRIAISPQLASEFIAIIAERNQIAKIARLRQFRFRYDYVASFIGKTHSRLTNIVNVAITQGATAPRGKQAYKAIEYFAPETVSRFIEMRDQEQLTDRAIMNALGLKKAQFDTIIFTLKAQRRIKSRRGNNEFKLKADALEQDIRAIDPDSYDFDTVKTIFERVGHNFLRGRARMKKKNKPPPLRLFGATLTDNGFRDWGSLDALVTYLENAVEPRIPIGRVPVGSSRRYFNLPGHSARIGQILPAFQARQTNTSPRDS